MTQEIQKHGVQVYSASVCPSWLLAFLTFYPPSPGSHGLTAHGESCARAEGDTSLSLKAIRQPGGPGRIRRLHVTAGQSGRAAAFTRYFNNSFMISFHSAWQNCSQNSCEEKLRHG